MADEKRVKSSGLDAFFGEGTRPGAVKQAWAVYRLDDKGQLIDIHHACLSELEANATKSLAQGDGVASVTVQAVTVILDSELKHHILGPSVRVMGSAEVKQAVREKAMARLDPAELALLGVE
jgi:hypothetical protein